MKFLLALLILAGIAITSVAQSVKHVASPEDIGFRDQLESMSSIVKLTCGLMMPITPGEKYAAEATKKQTDNNKYRLEFYKAVKQGRSAKLSYTCGADEGGTISYYMLAMNGKLTTIADFTRDPFGGRQFLKWECADLRLGNFVKKSDNEIAFEVLGDTDLNGKVLWLSCRTADRLITF